MGNDTVEFDVGELPVMKSRAPEKTRQDYVKPVVEYSPEGVFVAAYDSATAASKATGVNVSTIKALCIGTQLIASNKNGNRIFLFRGDDIIKRIEKIEANKDNYKFLFPKAHGKKVLEYTLGGRLLYTHPFGTIAARLHKVSSHLITNCCKGRRLFIDNRIFLYEDGDIKERVRLVKQELYKISNKRPKYRPVDAYTLEGNFIKSYPSASAAYRDLDVHVSDITRCCNGTDGYGHNYYQTKGKIFLWVGESISERLEQLKKIKQKVKAERDETMDT